MSKELREKFLQYISDSKLELVFQEFKQEHVRLQFGKEEQEALIMLSSRFTYLQAQQRDGVIGEKGYNLERKKNCKDFSSNI